MKKALALVLACGMIAGISTSAFATAYGYNDKEDTNDLSYENIEAGSSLSFDDVRPDTTYWIPVAQLLNESGKKSFGSYAVKDSAGGKVSYETANYLGDDDMFKFSFDKDGDGKSLIKSITVVNDKKVDRDSTDIRTTYLKVVTNQTFNDGEKKAKVEVTIKPKKSLEVGTSADKYDYDNVFQNGDKIKTSDKLVFNMTFWVKNAEKDGDSVDVSAGEGFVYNPANNEKNTIIYGDDRAAIYFEADDDADKFYAKLSTKSMSSIYSEYGDPADADLWFYDWVGNKTIPSTARATVTLGIPWDDDDDYVPNPEDCYIYQVNTDGTLTDVTDKFTYDADNDGTTEIEGWTMKTRTLGTYVLSDTELDIDEEEPASSTAPVESSSSVSTDGGNKGIPNTGSSDMVNVAVMAAVLSLAAAGAVAFKKASK